MTQRMDPEVKAEWVAALRSGDYTQDIESSLLHSRTGYCCLGVLCDLAVKAGVTVEHKSSDSLYTEYGTTAPLASAYLPKEVIKWAGLDSRNPVVRTGMGGDNLANVNDRGTPFAEIANLIEERL